MKYFEVILITVALAITGAVYYGVHSTACTEHWCPEGMRPALGKGLAGYACGCVRDR